MTNSLLSSLTLIRCCSSLRDVGGGGGVGDTLNTFGNESDVG